MDNDHFLPIDGPVFHIFYLLGIAYGFISVVLLMVAIANVCVAERPRALILSLQILAWAVLSISVPAAFAYIAEIAVASVGANAFERAAFSNRFFSIYGVSYWLTFASMLIPQLFWFRRFRTRPWPALVTAILICALSQIEKVFTL